LTGVVGARDEETKKEETERTKQRKKPYCDKMDISPDHSCRPIEIEFCMGVVYAVREV